MVFRFIFHFQYILKTRDSLKLQMSRENMMFAFQRPDMGMMQGLNVFYS